MVAILPKVSRESNDGRLQLEGRETRGCVMRRNALSSSSVPCHLWIVDITTILPTRSDDIRLTHEFFPPSDVRRPPI
jgi:hypothetical protein